MQCPVDGDNIKESTLQPCESVDSRLFTEGEKLSATESPVGVQVAGEVKDGFSFASVHIQGTNWMSYFSHADWELG